MVVKITDAQLTTHTHTHNPTECICDSLRQTPIEKMRNSIQLSADVFISSKLDAKK